MLGLKFYYNKHRDSRKRSVFVDIPIDLYLISINLTSTPRQGKCLKRFPKQINDFI